MRERKTLLDTSVIIDPPEQGMGRFADEVSVSAITVAELHYGVGASADPVQQLRRRQRLQLVLDTYDVLPFDADVAEFYGLLANVVRQAGRNPRPRRMDLLIAATAVRHGFSLATRNGADLRHLERVLAVIDVR
ncbi:MAG TPA: PIN domain-containing protein [Pseudonocardiaceae bacterium]|nr:PIN domain-containing protein [Pseudonocardiaceae bacterium]